MSEWRNYDSYKGRKHINPQRGLHLSIDVVAFGIITTHYKLPENWAIDNRVNMDQCF